MAEEYARRNDIKDYCEVCNKPINPEYVLDGRCTKHRTYDYETISQRIVITGKNGEYAGPFVSVSDLVASLQGMHDTIIQRTLTRRSIRVETFRLK